VFLLGGNLGDAGLDGGFVGAVHGDGVDGAAERG
jgi:hypothetical protein